MCVSLHTRVPTLRLHKKLVTRLSGEGPWGHRQRRALYATLLDHLVPFRLFNRCVSICSATVRALTLKSRTDISPTCKEEKYALMSKRERWPATARRSVRSLHNVAEKTKTESGRRQTRTNACIMDDGQRLDIELKSNPYISRTYCILLFPLTFVRGS